MVSKEEEEVRKRRAKEQSGSPKIYRKLVLLVGVIAVLLAIGLSPRMAPMLSAGIIGITVLLFFWLKNHQPKGKEEEPALAEWAEAPEEKVIDPPRIDSEGPEKELVWEKDPEEPGRSAKIPEIFSENKAKEQEDVGEERGGSLQECVGKMEARLAKIEEKLVKLEERMAGFQEMALKSDDKVDLQKIFSQMDERGEDSAKPQRSYLVQTEIPTP